MTFLRVEAISKAYAAVPALRDISFTVDVGAHVAVVGPSASGKSTLLRLIAGFETPDAGRICLDDGVLADAHHAVPAHRRRIGYVAQDGALFPHLTIAANIGFGLPRDEPDRAARIAALMSMVELDPAIGARRPDQISGGQQQRVAIARALAQRPRLMLLDEPFSALDSSLREATRNAASRLLRAQGITTILVTHDQPEALSFADHVVVLRAGTLAQHGTPIEVYERPRTPDIATYLGDAIVLPARLDGAFATCALGEIAIVPSGEPRQATIMLRPEQLKANRIDDSASGNSHPAARIVSVDYRGGDTTIAVELLQSGGKGNTLSLRFFGRPLPAVDDIVGIQVEGTAHVFA